MVIFFQTVLIITLITNYKPHGESLKFNGFYHKKSKLLESDDKKTPKSGRISRLLKVLFKIKDHIIIKYVFKKQFKHRTVKR